MKDTPCIHCTRRTPAVKRLSPKDHRTTQAQMYQITAPKIFVLAPNFWETMTEFSSYNSRKGRSFGSRFINVLAEVGVM
jgi:hypothetical protein